MKLIRNEDIQKIEEERNTKPTYSLYEFGKDVAKAQLDADLKGLQAERKRIVEEILDELKIWTIDHLNKITAQREYLKATKPKDINVQIVLGSKRKAYQSLMDKLQSLKSRILKGEL